MDKPPDMIEKEKYLRLAADFDNYQKRMKEELAQTVQFGNERLLLEIADVVDAIERSKNDTYDMGRLLEQLLKKNGMVRIDTQGKAFDPTIMEAVQMKPPDHPQHAGTVASEVRAGYLMHGRVVRPARVVINQL